MEAIGLGWRISHWEAVVVGACGSASVPVVVHREQVALIDDPAVREPYHAAAHLPLSEAPAFIQSVAEQAALAARTVISRLASSLGSLAAVGVVGGDRQVPTDLSRVFAKHASQHACDRDLYEKAVIEGATRAGLPIRTLPATGKLFDEASRVLGVQVEPSLVAIGKSIGSPWQKVQREAAAAAFVALAAVK